MTLAEFLQLLGLFTAGGLVVLGAVVYLLKHVLKRWIDRTFATKEKEIDLQNRLLEHQAQVTFSSLHVQRADAIRNIYDKLIEFKAAVLDVVNRAHLNDGKGQDRFAKFWTLALELHTMVEREGIYLDQKTCDLILKVTNSYDQAALTMQVGAGVPIDYAAYVPKLERSREIIQKDCLGALAELQEQFRKILGVV
ncbi:MAG: hypothetical protein JNL52_03060 [Flavobacteriales bacterium]|nr:hypothetical protein [Flavobacteriales bacterium]